MNKAKIVIEYILKFLISILLLILILLCILKITVFNKDNLKNILLKNNYYENVYNTIKEDMENYIVSSGFSESILDDIFTKQNVKESINIFIDNFYENKNKKDDLNKVKLQINSNIENYIKDEKIQIFDQESIDSLVNELLKIYTNETNLYNMVNGFRDDFNKLENIANISLIVIIIILIITIALLVVKKVKFKGIISFSSGLMLLYIRFLITNKIDYKNILLITDNFSTILVQIIQKTIDLILICGIILCVIGLINIIIDSIKKWNKKEE